MTKNCTRDAIFSVVDIETTGLSIERDEIIEICIIQVKDLKIINEYETLIKPTGKIKLSSIEIHGLDNDMLMTAPDKNFVVKRVTQILSNTILVEHNINNFDSEFLGKFLDKKPWKGTTNTIRLAKLVTSDIKKYDLRSLCKSFSIQISEEHSARADVTATAKLFIRILHSIEHNQALIDNVLGK